MSRSPINVLVLCTGNSARSILGEVLFNELSNGRFNAFSAGSQPVGQVNPGAIDKLTRAGHPVKGLDSKSWDRFSGPEAPEIDIVITVCDNAAGESCPIWNGAPVTAHWGIPDPASAADPAPAFDAAYDALRARVEALIEVPMEDFDVRQRLDALKRIHDALSAPASE